MTAQNQNFSITLPYQEVREAIFQTTLEIGCSTPTGHMVAQSAWHLTNRGLNGVAYALRFLSLLINHDDIDKDALPVLGHEISRMLNKGERRTCGRVVPNAPLLVLPYASFNLRNEGAETDAILFTFDAVTLVYSNAHGLRVIDGALKDIERVDALFYPTCTSSRIDYSDPMDHGIDLGFKRHDKLDVPTAVYAGPGKPLRTDIIRQILASPQRSD